jgi:hypothetical protein
VSVGAEGLVKVWDVAGPSGGGALALSWGYAGLDADGASGDDAHAPGCTAVEAIKTDIKKVAVAFQNSVIKIFDVETGKELSRITSESGRSASISSPQPSLTFPQTAQPSRKSTRWLRIRQCRCWSPRMKTSTFVHSTSTQVSIHRFGRLALMHLRRTMHALDACAP